MSKKIQAVIFDWAGTTVDYGCTGPLKVIIELFKLKDIAITVEEAKKPMGLLKINHIHELLKMERIRKAYLDRYGHEANDETLNEFYQLFEKLIFVELTKPTETLPGVLEAVSKLRTDGIKIGSTSGYTKEMMDIIAPLAERVGYKPDFRISSSEVPNGRPYPWMIFQNALHFGLHDFSRFVKVGDSTVDIHEGRSANAWSVGVVEGSSMISMKKEEFDSLSSEEQLKLKKSARKELMEAGADFVIDSMHELPDLIEEINKKLGRGELPGGKLQVPKQPYLLFTPGPITTSLRVKIPTLEDWGSRETDFISLISSIKRELLNFTAPSNSAAYEVILMQGSGTFGVESVISTAVPKVNSKLLVLINGNYGMRMAQMAKIHGINTVCLEFDESDVPDEGLVLQTLNEQPDITHVALVHSETTTGIVNPLEKFAKLIKSQNKVLIVDGMSSFGAIPFDVNELGIDFVVGSANKGFQGIPGFCFIIAKRSELVKCEGNGRTLSLDMFEQWRFAEKTNQFRFTPPVHSLRAFYEALQETKDEGGVQVRFKRYTENQRVLVDGMTKLGFKAIDLKGYQGPIITSFHSPTCPKYSFSKFYELLKDKKCVLYPGKLTKADTFRVGSISVNKSDILELLDMIKENIFWDQTQFN